MNLLALETSTHRLSVALWRDGACLERAEEIANGGSERLLPWVQELLDEAGMTLAQFDGIAFGAGPGGFTGLRLACGVAQGLACGLDLPVVGIGTLEALALAARQRDSTLEYVFACLDARMNEVYCAAYRLRGDVAEEVQAPSVAPPLLVTPPPDKGWVGCGDGFVTYPDLLVDRLARIEPGLWPTAAAVAQLAAPRFARGEGVDAGLAAPLYVRDKVALTTAERLARGGAK